MNITLINSNFQLILPQSTSPTNPENPVSCNGVLVILGANGSGKTRLGVWIEENNPVRMIYRVAAQKSLQFPLSVSILSHENAQLEFVTGLDVSNYEESHKLEIASNVVGYKRSHRWGNKPNTALLNDYASLVKTLFAEHMEQALQYKQASEASGTFVTPSAALLHEWAVMLRRRAGVRMSV